MTKRLALGEWVAAVLTSLPRPSYDGRSNVWRWKCGHCGSDRNAPFDTRMNSSSKTCDQCGADNYVSDFDAEHARIKAGRLSDKDAANMGEMG